MKTSSAIASPENAIRMLQRKQTELAPSFDTAERASLCSLASWLPRWNRRARFTLRRNKTAELALNRAMASAQDGLEFLVWQSMARAREAGLDAAAAARRAMQAVRMARPDLTPDEAHALVDLAGPASPCRAA